MTSAAPGSVHLVARTIVLALCLAASAAVARAQSIDQYVGKPVAAVRMQIEGREEREPQLLELVDTRIGQPLSMADVRETIVHLHGLGRFQDVEVHATLTPGGSVDLLYALVPIHGVRRVVFRGQLGMSEGTLRDFVRDRFGTAPAVGRAAEAARSLTQLLRERGFLTATVTPQPLVEHAPERTTLIFTVEAGPRARIGRVTVAGDEPRNRPPVRTRSALQPGEAFDRVAIASALEGYVNDLKSRGYYQARADYVLREGDGAIADLEISVETGPRIEIVFKGDPVPSRVRRELVPVEKEGSVDEDLLEDSRARIEAYFHAQGYRDAQAPYEWAGGDTERQLAFTIRRGPQYRLADYEITGNTAIPTREILPLLRLERGKPYVQAILMADVGRISGEYRRRGYNAVKIDPVPVPGAPAAPAGGGPPAPLLVKIAIAEGPRTEVRSVTFTGQTAFTETQLLSDVTSKPGRPYYEPQVGNDRDTITLRYFNGGYPNVVVDPQITFSEDKTRADLQFRIIEGPQVFIDHVLIVGNNRTSAAMIANEITLRAGDPLRLSAINDSQARLAALGLFRRVRITELPHSGDETRQDLLVSVDEAPLTTYGFGGGVEGGQQLRRASGEGQAEEVFQVAPRGFFEIGRRNLWGKNRTVNLFTRITLRPRNATTSSDPTAPQGGYGFNEYRVLGTLREPKIFGTAADGVVTAFTEQAVRSSFNFARRAVQAEAARRLRPTLSVLGRYSFERARIFDADYKEEEKPQIDRFFSQVRLSSFSAAVVRDTRDDALDPSKGVFLSFESSLAARRIGSEVGFTRTFIQGFFFKAVPTGRRAIVAAAARLGVARGFPREAVVVDGDGNPILGPDGQPQVEVVRDIPASERFFAGGNTTVRGFGLDRLGTPEIVDSDGFSKGGDALLVLNGELRVDAGRGLQIAGFFDAGNVFARTRDVGLLELRPAAGFGIRYKSPIGPLRFDIGFNLNRRRFGGGRLEDAREYHLTLGQAF